MRCIKVFSPLLTSSTFPRTRRQTSTENGCSDVSNTSFYASPRFAETTLSEAQERIAQEHATRVAKIQEIVEKYDQAKKSGTNLSGLKDEYSRGEFAITNLIAALKASNAAVVFMNKGIDVKTSLNKLEEINGASAI